MLYLDYGRKAGEWVPNKFGGHENLDAVEFLKQLNLAVYRDYPNTQTIAEESTAWPMVSRPTYLGGLGFGGKWNMGWMHDTLKYFQTDPMFRKYQHNSLTFSIWYAFTENFVLPISHDEVVHGKRSLIGKIPGDAWQKLATLRLVFGYQWTLPGKKLLFMGGELGVLSEWNHDAELDWALAGNPAHGGIARWLGDLNAAYRTQPALHAGDCEPWGFRWIIADDRDASVLVYARFAEDAGRPIVVVANFTPVPRDGYRLGVPRGGFWREVLNSDAEVYGGSGLGNRGGMHAEPVAFRDYEHSLVVTAPPLAVVLFAAES